MAKIFLPKQQDREIVRRLAGVGTSENDIAARLQIPLKRLQKRFKKELEQGIADANISVAEQLHALAASGKSATASMFWIGARYGWRDTGTPPVPSTQIISKLIIECAEHGLQQPSPTTTGDRNVTLTS